MPENFPTPYVFVYDVFLKDAVKHVQIVPYIKTWSRAEMPGKLYQLPTGLPIVVEEEAPAAAPAVPAAPGKVFGEVMTFEEMDEVMKMIDRQEGYREDAPANSRLVREVREVTLTPTGEKVKAMVYLCPKEKFNPKDMFAVHAHGGDWRKFVMMPRFDGYQH
jgi:gamma-glutamylcyclotransferase (GGCT)/AIG2-like uncharacterized protein YtfP